MKYVVKVRKTLPSQPASFDLFDCEDVGGMRPQPLVDAAGPLAGVSRHASRDLEHHVPMVQQVLVVLVPQMVDMRLYSSGSCSSSPWSRKFS